VTDRIDINGAQLAQICRFAHDCSSAGLGLSIRDAIKRCQYRELRDRLTEEQVRRHVSDHSELIDQWSAYSSDKRTSGGWYFDKESRGWVVGRLDARGRRTDETRYAAAEVACAVYIIKELEFWSSPADRR
jgi:hypothetical protein